MGKWWSLIFGILGITALIATFFTETTISTLFGFEINIWWKRALYGLIVISCFADYHKKAKGV